MLVSMKVELKCTLNEVPGRRWEIALHRRVSINVPVKSFMSDAGTSLKMYFSYTSLSQ